MSKCQRVGTALNAKLVLAAGAAAIAATFGLATVAVAEAGVAMADVQATGGSGTKVDTDGTQGDLKPAVQGKKDDDGDQDAYAIGSEIATPQYKGH